MWIIFTLISVFLIALVNYIDDELTADNPVKLSSDKLDPHIEVGGLVLISTLMSFVGALVVLLIFNDQIVFEQTGVLLSIGSAVPFVFLFASYFYLLRRYPVYQVIPLYLLSSVWLLIIEILSGVPISIPQIIAVFLIIIGSYFLDIGKLEWKIPGKLLVTMIPVTIVWAFGLFLVRLASKTLPGTTISFWQFSGIGVIGIFLLLFVKRYRSGFLIRIREQGKKFLGLSFCNESLSQGSYFFGNLAIAAAPAATFVSALNGLQGLFIILIFLGFGRDVKVNKIQVFSIAAIVIGAFAIERF